MDPRLTKIRQHFQSKALSDPISVLRGELARLDALIRPGAQIAIAVGSRGISNLPTVVSEVVSFVRQRQAQPFLVPAMGSHGGATADGQAEVLASYGISESRVSAPVRATMEVVELARGNSPVDVYMDRHAAASDGIILINRIKPHTDFHGRYESGLMKMALIGLGKQEGARAVHRFGVRGLREFIEPGARAVLAAGKVLGGVALVEDAYHATMIVKVLKGGEIADQEPALLDLAKTNMPRLPVSDVDVLVVDRMGKDISGVGIDPNITGRIGVEGENDPNGPRVKAMVVCDLSDASHGNAIGVGLADAITQRLFEKIDRDITYANVVTSGFLERGKIPVAGANDREAFNIALTSCPDISRRDPRIVRISDTLQLEDVYLSNTALAEVKTAATIIESNAILFDETGWLTSF